MAISLRLATSSLRIGLCRLIVPRYGKIFFAVGAQYIPLDTNTLRGTLRPACTANRLRMYQAVAGMG